VLQPGNSLAATWRARLDEHLGYYVVEGLELRAAAFLPAAHAVFGVTHLAALCRLLPERDPHEQVFEALDAALGRLGDPAEVAVLVARFELQLLAELGFGLDLSACAATGELLDLVFVSPKSGRAVSRAAGEAWRDRLLALPAFLGEEEGPPPSADDLAAAFALTGFFLERHLYAPHGAALPDARAAFIVAVTRAIARVA
jgi:DNA repair protein RecO (recombination protein O)